MKSKVLIGCSSFNSVHWKNIFYPKDLPQTKWFEYYCTHFGTYEMNSTFYKFPTVKTMKNWYKKAPEKFLFSVKAPKEITHIKKFTDCKNVIEDFYAICKEGLKDKLGCILFQLPPSYQYDHEKLLRIVAQLNPEFNNVIEFRHQSWWISEVWQELSKNNITFCSVNHPKLPTTIVLEMSLIYIRLHGRTSLFYSSYSHDELTDINHSVSSRKEKTAFIYFNNTAGTAGVLNAMELININKCAY